MVNFVGLVLSTWLGIYIVTHSRRSWVAWLSGLTLWSLAGLFSNVLLYLFTSAAPAFQPIWLRILFPVWPQEAGEHTLIGWTQGWASILAIVFWYHTSVLIVPGKLQAWRRVSVFACYAMGILAPILQVNTPYLFSIARADPLFTDTVLAGPLFPIFTLAMLIFPALTVLNQLHARRLSDSVIVKLQLDTLIAASLVAYLTVILSVVSTMRGFSIPVVWLSLLMVASVGIIGYGVTRYSALIGQRILRRDIVYSAVSIAMVVLIYMGMFWWLNVGYDLPPGIVVFLVPLLILTHSLTEEARRVLERFIYDRRTRTLRSRLRELNRLAGEQADLGGLLSSSLVTISASVRATFAVVLVFDDNLAHPVGAYHWHESKAPLSRMDFLAEEVKHLSQGSLPEPFRDATLLIPLYTAEEQFGALLLGRPENGIHYSSEDLLLLQDPTERIEEIITRNKRISFYLDQFSQMPLKQAELPQELIPIQWVEDALQNVYDFAYLGDSPLVNLHQVAALLVGPSVTHLDRGKAVYQVISGALEKLRPEDAPPGEPVPREWHPYVILHDAYFDGLPNRDILLKLYISEGTFHRTRRAALRSVARVLSEMETTRV